MKTKLQIAKERREKKELEKLALLKREEEKLDRLDSLDARLLDLYELLNGQGQADYTKLIEQMEFLSKTLDFSPLIESLEGLNTLLTTSHEVSNKTNIPGLSELIQAVKDNKPLPAKVDVSKIEAAVKSIHTAIKANTVKPSQNAEDYMPVRRVIRVGKRFLFDDNITSGAAGGGGSSASFDTTGLATEAKQDDIVTAIGGISGTTKYVTLIDEDTTPNVTYIGKAVPTGSAIATSTAAWQITRIDESTSPTTIKYADGNLLFDNTFTSLGSKTYA